MATIDVYNLQKEKISQIELQDDIFQIQIKQHLLHQVVVNQLLNRRSGSASSGEKNSRRGITANL